MLDRLAPSDRVALVLFSTNVCVPQQLSLVSCTNMATLKASIQSDVVDEASTNLQEGLDTGALHVCKQCQNCPPPFCSCGSPALPYPCFGHSPA